MKNDCTNGLTPAQQKARELTRRWFKAHPGYQRTRKAELTQRRILTGISLNGNLPVTITRVKGKLPYNITPRKGVTS